ncbi:MAG TPA: ParB N-terminal domain-containing protein [Candidatus Bathyarchaeia archaeon]|nr:ParB N-terminal domain-containing protein [Candidatus Bathyarchaeia archaeon]
MDLNSSGSPSKISLIEIEQLKPHEEVIEHQVHEIVAEMRLENKVRDPLIVDDKKHIILDGMHRFDSLKELGCVYAPCYIVDYDSPEIQVGSWFRFSKIDDYDSTAQKVLDELQLTYKKNERVNNINFNRTIIITKRSVFEQTEPSDPVYKARLAVKIEKVLIKQGFKIQYEPENTMEQYLETNISNFVIPLPIFTKTDIRRIALSGQLLPHKVTRHLIPSRPLCLNVPLPFLLDRTGDIKNANKKLDTFLSGRRIDRKPPGSIIDGRRYQEELLVFST